MGILRALSRRAFLASGTALTALALPAAARASGSTVRAAGAAARPSTQPRTLTVTLQSAWQLPWTNVAAQMNQEWFRSNYRRRGIEVNVQPGSTIGQVIASSLAGVEGTYPDIVVLGAYAVDTVAWVGSGLATPLGPLVQRDNIDVAGLFGAAAAQNMTFAGSLLGMMAYFSPQGMYYNKDALDASGLPYPDPAWDWQEAQKLWTACVRPPKTAGGTYRAGVSISDSAYFAQLNWLLRAWGAREVSPDGSHALTDSPEAVAMATFIQESFRNHSMIGWTFPWTCLLQQQAVFNNNQVNFLGQVAQALTPAGLHWDMVPNPVWPGGKSAFGETFFYSLNAASKEAAAAWDLLQFVCVQPGYQRFLMRSSLLTPALLGLWPEWERTVKEVAPPLRNMHLSWVTDAVREGYAVAPSFFPYDTAQADNVIDTWFPKIEAGTVSAALGMREMTQQLNAVEVAGAQAATGAARQEAAFRLYVAKAEASKTAITYPAPPANGSGVPFSPAPHLVGQASGTWRLQGAGAGVKGESDNCTFAGAAYRSSAGTFTCRVVALSVPNGAALPNGAKVGLMARGDLSDNAASIELEVAGGRGVHFQVRAVSAVPVGDTRPASPAADTGLFGSGVILANAVKGNGNHLLKPVWLRLVLSVDAWTPSTSFDGVHWTVAAPAAVARFVGAWVGLFVTSNRGGQFVQAVFDHVSGFQPDQFVQIGSAGSA